jgi:hypothetical protein
MIEQAVRPILSVVVFWGTVNGQPPLGHRPHPRKAVR